MSPTEIRISPMAEPAAERGPVEIVERKGLGHPDTICDALAEEFSRALCGWYESKFGMVLHHNVDKVLLWGGAARAAFGGGEVLEPLEIYLSGRATREYKGEAVPVEELAIETCRSWLGAHLHALDPARHVRFHCLVRPGSADLVDLWERQQRSGLRLANDTSCGVGYAPQSALENAVLAVEHRLNAPELKARAPEVGEDVKVMGVRRGEHMHLTVACAFVDRFVSDAEDYAARRDGVAALAREAGREAAGRDVSAEVNTADDLSTGNVYLTVTGTSAEAGDDGEAGRGNRANGLITPYRPMTMESVAGKNPITHVGKLYNVAARRMAEELVVAIPEVAAAQVYLVSQIGRPIGEPQITDVRLALSDDRTRPRAAARAEEIALEHLAGMDGVWEVLRSGELPVY